MARYYDFRQTLSLLMVLKSVKGQRVPFSDEGTVGLEFKTMVLAAQSQRSAKAADGRLISEIPIFVRFTVKR